jgi:mannose-6-phosphate isomerase-like protein (cupin superfamily)
MADELLFCQDLDRAIALMTRLGLRLDTIFPADDPTVAVMSGQGAQVRLVRSDAVTADAANVPEPVDLASLPPRAPTTLVARSVDAAWTVGRAGMRYRDLIPYRAGGRYIGSHIVILDGGPVPDYVHYHAIQFHMVYCYRGWVRVVYEDQGEPFVMQAGDCVLQPPRIRHRVLEASPGLEVVEVAAPAVHATHVDHERALPTAELRPDRDYDGQRFVRFTAATARYSPSAFPGFDACELGIAAATRGFGSARVLRARDPSRFTAQHGADLLFHFVLRGRLTLDDEAPLGPAAAFTVPAGRPFAWSDASPDLELLQVALPGELGLELQ